jgi:hypothetical protein
LSEAQTKSIMTRTLNCEIYSNIAAAYYNCIFVTESHAPGLTLFYLIRRNETRLNISKECKAQYVLVQPF